ncbi:MAG TPA: BatA domain-containing protein, partial [Planctomycetota bacterium]|nr:BatA domain-containing protein [Planctomycetota bacterium]
MASFFLNPLMLWGLLVASIPIIIHLLNRRRHRALDWGAMRFLKVAFVTRHRRVRIEELILLILRTMLLAVLALVMARPFITSRQFSSAENRKDLVIVLDASFSTGLKSQGTTLFNLAKAEARNAIDTLDDGDAVSVILASSVPRPLVEGLSYDFEGVKEKLLRSHESLSSLNMPLSLDRALALLAKGQNPIREVLIITDGQSQGWAADRTATWQDVADQIDAFERRPRIYVLNVARKDKVANLGIREIELRRTVVGTDRDVRITINIKNSGETDVEPGHLDFGVDGTRVRQVNLEKLLTGAPTSTSFVYRFKTPGSHFITAELDADSLDADNRAYFGLEVLEKLPVLLVDGSSSNDPLKRASLFLEAALQPTPRYVVHPKVIAPAGLLETSLSEFRVVLLVDVPALGATEVTKLTEFVRRGGGLLIVPGPRTDVDDWNATLWQKGAGLLPTRLLQVVGDPAKRDEPPFRISETGLRNYAATRLLADREKSDLGDAQIFRYVKMDARGAAVPLRLTNADPLLVERRLDKGHVMVVACSLDAQWSDLAMRNAFVVLVHEMIYYLASPLLPAHNIPAGKDLVVVLDEADPAQKVELDLPLGAHEELTVRRNEGRREAVFENTREAGLYKATWRGRNGLVRRYYVVNFDPAESDLTALSAASRELLETQTGMRFYENWSELEGALKVGQDTREFWRWLAVFTVLLLLTEVFLTRFFSRRRAMETEGVSFGPSSAEAPLDAARGPEPVEGLRPAGGT